MKNLLKDFTLAEIVTGVCVFIPCSIILWMFAVVAVVLVVQGLATPIECVEIQNYGD